MRFRRPQVLLATAAATAAFQILASCVPTSTSTGFQPVEVSATVASQSCTASGRELTVNMTAGCYPNGVSPTVSLFPSADSRTVTGPELPYSFISLNNQFRFTAPPGLEAAVLRANCDGNTTDYLFQFPDCNADAGLGDAGVGGDATVSDAALGDAGVGADATVSDAALSDASMGGDAGASTPDASVQDASAPDAGPSLLGYAYVASGPLNGVGNGSVQQFKAMSDGTLVAMSPASLPAGNRPARVEVASIAGARFLYATNTGSDTVSQFSIGADGRLTALSPATVSVQVEPDTLRVVGSNLYVVNSGSRSISQFSIGADGRLAALSPATVATGTAANGTVPVGLCELGNRMYVASAGGTEGVTVYNVGTGGALSSLGQVATISGGYTAIACAPDGTHLYTVGGTALRQFSRSGDTLAPLSPASVTVDSGVSNLVLNRAGTRLFTSNFINLNLDLFNVSGTGALSAMNPASVSTLDSPNAVAFDPSSTYFYVIDAAGGISAYTVGAMGSGVTLTPTGRAGLGIAVIAP